MDAVVAGGFLLVAAWYLGVAAWAIRDIRRERRGR
jgi:hypothetical protein